MRPFINATRCMASLLPMLSTELTFSLVLVLVLALIPALVSTYGIILLFKLELPLVFRPLLPTLMQYFVLSLAVNAISLPGPRGQHCDRCRQCSMICHYLVYSFYQFHCRHVRPRPASIQYSGSTCPYFDRISQISRSCSVIHPPLMTIYPDGSLPPTAYFNIIGSRVFHPFASPLLEWHRYY